MLLKLDLRLHWRFADLPLATQPLPVSGKPEYNELTLVVDLHSDRLSVECPHKRCVVGTVLRLIKSRRHHAPTAQLYISEYRADFLRRSSDTRNYVCQARIGQLLQRHLPQRLNQLVEVLDVRNKRHTFAGTLSDVKTVGGGHSAADGEQLLDHRDSLEKIPAVLLRRDASCPVNSESRKYRLSPRCGGRPPAERLAEDLEGVAVERLGHCDRLSMVEGKA